MFAHCAGSRSLASCQTWRGATTYQGAIANKFGKVLVFPFVDARFQNTQGHRLLDDVVVVGNIALVDTAMEQSRRVVATAQDNH